MSIQIEVSFFKDTGVYTVSTVTPQPDGSTEYEPHYRCESIDAAGDWVRERGGCLGGITFNWLGLRVRNGHIAHLEPVIFVDDLPVVDAVVARWPVSRNFYPLPFTVDQVMGLDE